MIIYIFYRDIEVSDLRVWILTLCLLNSLNFFVHYGFLSYDSARKTNFLNYLFKNLLYMDFAMYYLKKAGRLLREECKRPLFTFLKFFKLLMILAIFLNAAFTLSQLISDESTLLC